MKKIGFIGAFSKTDLIIYIAKIITRANKKVLVIDSTVLGKAKYIVPAIHPSRIYITEFEEIDVAVGFNNLDGIKQYIGEQELNYDVILIDIDSPENFRNFEMENADKNYFITAFDNYSLKRGLEIIEGLQQKIKMTKVMFSKNMSQEEEEYLNFLSFKEPVIWEKEKIYFPYELGDESVIIENQMAGKIRFRNLSMEYKYGLEVISSQIVPEVKYGEIKRIIKNI